jgi:hypothetical protein
VSGSAGNGKSQLSTGAIAGIAVACGLLLIGLASLAIFSLLQKRRTRELSGGTNPFGKVPKNMIDNYVAIKKLLSISCKKQSMEIWDA